MKYPKTFFGNKIVTIILVILFVLAGCASAYFYIQYNNLKKSESFSAEKEAEQLIARVDKLVILPESETPTIATVTDAAKLSGQEFFKDIANDDKILVYKTAKKIVIYRPSADKIVNISNLTEESSEQVKNIESIESTATDSKTE